MMNEVSWIHKVLGVWSQTFPNIQSKVFKWLQFQMLPWASHYQRSPISLSSWLPSRDGFLPRTFPPHSTGNASKSTKGWALAPSAEPTGANCVGIQGNGVNTTCPWTSFPSSPSAGFPSIAIPQQWPSHLDSEAHQCLSSTAMWLKLPCQPGR